MALKPAADGPNSLGPGSATSRSPWWGPLPSPSSHSGRSEAPENSETGPREKGNLGLPVLLTDGSTHLEQIVGSERGPCRVATPPESSRELNGPKTPRSARARRWGGRWGGQRSLVQTNCSAAAQGRRVSLRRAAAASAATVSSSWSWVVGERQR